MADTRGTWSLSEAWDEKASAEANYKALQEQAPIPNMST